MNFASIFKKLLMEIFKKYWLLILIGLLLRLFVAAFTYHSDVKQPALSSAIFFQKGSLDFYSLSSNDDLPLTYLINLPVHFMARPLISSDLENVFLASTEDLFGNPTLGIYLIYAKLPFILMDLGLAILLSVSVLDIYRKKVLILWLFNPFTLWFIAGFGQFDIYPVFFVVLAWFLITKGKLKIAALSLGLGGAIKFFPFLLIPYLLGLTKSVKEKILILGISLLPYFLTVIPYLELKDFRQNAFLAPQISKSLYASIPLSGGESIFMVLGILVFLYLLFFSKERAKNDFLSFSLVSLLLLLAFTHFHVQWFLWVMPFLILWMIDNLQFANKLAIWGILTSLILMIFSFEASLQMRLFAPLIPNLADAKGLSEILSSSQVIFLKSLAASIFASCTIFLSWKVLTKK